MNTKNKILRKVLFPVLSCSLLLNSCTDKFEEYNQDPYGVTEEMLTYDNFKIGSFFPQLEQYVIPNPANLDAYVYQTNQNLFGDVYSGYMATIGSWNGGVNSTVYNFDNNWTDKPFDSFVYIISAWREIKKYTQESNPEVFALAQVLKIAGIQRLTDMYGPMPYSQVGVVEMTVAYDSQEAIYESFFKELDAAIKVMTNFVIANPSAKFSPEYDLVYHGDYLKWIKFANSLKLRMALRISKVKPDQAQIYAEAAVHHQFGVIQDNSENAQLPVENNPLERITNGYDEVRMGASMESILTGYKDPRIEKYFLKGKLNGKEGFYGIRNGVMIRNNAPYTGFSKLNFSKSSPLMWLSAAEVSFLKAEGALRGWNMNGTAQEFYEDGIKKSFDQWGASGYEEYVADNESVPAHYQTSVVNGHNIQCTIKTIIKWDEAADFQQKLAKVMTQKWIAVYPNGQEGWSEYRRTGFPAIFPILVNRSAGKVDTREQVKRIPFPHCEYQTNEVNVREAVTLLGGPDTGGTNLWWDVD